ncbi:LamG-like jellyroll fold domain-containing protein [Clostridium botulinum]|uniref:LamG-like jellyroll fold domain-containing protein n=1 Tax=Clostridium botulinum TaxID=1491 RepID=UPI00174896F7|nr:LamG-like jellyroll fold domain-containing protein [Clostridium botulinum]MBD5589219.1 hypothetical protein [Clostridium botulinum]
MAYIPKKDYSSNLISNYKFEETTGTTCIDSTGKYNGVYYGTTSVAGENGNARSFNGTKEYISTNLIIPKKNSIKFKIKTSVNNNNVLYIFNSDNGGTGFDLYLQNGTLTIALYCNNYKPYKSIKFNKIISDNNWHTCLITNSGIFIKFYIDNLISTEYTLDSSFWTGNTASTFWGCHRNTLGNYFNGQLDEIEIYDEVVEFTYNKYYLINQNNNYYSTKSNFINLGQHTDNTQLENWYNKYGADDVNIITQNLNNKEFPMTKNESGIWKTDFELDMNDVTNNINLVDTDENNKSIKYDCNDYRIIDLCDDEFDIRMYKER